MEMYGKKKKDIKNYHFDTTHLNKTKKMWLISDWFGSLSAGSFVSHVLIHIPITQK